MGELVMGSENGIMGLEMRETEVKAADGGAAAETTAGGVRWERFLPNMAVRVLLVEADDSTRQIVAALLRKCSYKVAAVSDGLKAWELLKGRPHNIDLILTEVELPSISGFALLTLIMEHDICKNIPVIMMSTHDSVSTVYNCMLRGAADFLVKPLRKNELRNLWQHVWRRQASSASGPGPPDENLAQQKIEATAENNGVSNHSSGYMACIRRNHECIERGSDAQSSCTKPEVEAEEEDIEHLHNLSHPKLTKCLSDDKNVYAQEKYHQEIRKTQAHDNQTGDNIVVSNYVTTQRHDKNSDDYSEQVNKIICPNFESNNGHEKDSFKVAIDLIGAFDNYLKGNLESPVSNASTNKFDIFPPLDLSLRRYHPSSSVNQVNDETRRLNHSDASAFSRYINKPLPPRNSTSPSTCNQTKHHETNSEKQLSNYTPDYNSDQISSRKHLQLATFSYPQQREISQPIPVKGVRFENVMNGFASMMPQMYYQQSGLSPLPSPRTVSNLQFCPQFHNVNDQRINNPSDRTDKEQGRRMENMEDESGNSSFYNEHTSKEGFVVHEGASHRSMQREAALNKFRQKRKDRCFDKKVRYESRKKLAEQRPRVKGQFVRQVPNGGPQLGS